MEIMVVVFDLNKEAFEKKYIERNEKCLTDDIGGVDIFHPLFHCYII